MSDDLISIIRALSTDARVALLGPRKFGAQFDRSHGAQELVQSRRDEGEWEMTMGGYGRSTTGRKQHFVCPQWVSPTPDPIEETQERDDG